MRAQQQQQQQRRVFIISASVHNLFIVTSRRQILCSLSVVRDHFYKEARARTRASTSKRLCDNSHKRARARAHPNKLEHERERERRRARLAAVTQAAPVSSFSTSHRNKTSGAHSTIDWNSFARACVLLRQIQKSTNSFRRACRSSVSALCALPVRSRSSHLHAQ